MLPNSSSPEKRLSVTWWIFGIIIFVAVALLFVMFQQGGLLSARVFNSQTQETGSNDSSQEAEGDIYAQKENYCQAQKEAFIIDCGDVVPEEDYVCRTKQADDFYTECLVTVTDEQVRVTDYELPVSDNEPSLDF